MTELNGLEKAVVLSEHKVSHSHSMASATELQRRYYCVGLAS